MVVNLQNPLARAKGHGSAKHGAQHWWQQRLTSLLLIPLVIWLLMSINHLLSGGYAESVAYLQHPVHAGFAIALIATLMYHTKLGLQVVVEDYVHSPWLETTLQLGIKLFAWAGALAGALAVLKIAFGG